MRTERRLSKRQKSVIKAYIAITSENQLNKEQIYNNIFKNKNSKFINN